MSEYLQKICTRLYEQNRGDLYAFIVRNMRDESSALDLLQDVFYYFYKFYLDKKLPPNDVECRKYLFKMARNLMINHSKTAYKRKVDLVENLDLSMPASNTVEASILNEMERESAETALQDLLGRLEEKYRTPLLLRYHSEMKLEEIAQIMNTTISSVSRQIKKAEQLLKQYAKEEGLEFSPE